MITTVRLPAKNYMVSWLSARPTFDVAYAEMLEYKKGLGKIVETSVKLDAALKTLHQYLGDTAHQS